MHKGPRRYSDLTRNSTRHVWSHHGSGHLALLLHLVIGHCQCLHPSLVRSVTYDCLYFDRTMYRVHDWIRCTRHGAMPPFHFRRKHTHVLVGPKQWWCLQVNMVHLHDQNIRHVCDHIFNLNLGWPHGHDAYDMVVGACPLLARM
jgi:hypothetical protein